MSNMSRKQTLNYKSIVDLEQIEDDDELALNELDLYDE